jgi:hypothetical protein
LSDFSGYGNPGISSCGDGSEGGVIGFGDKGDIGFGDKGDIGFDVGVGVGVVVVTFFIVFGIPHIFDSVVLTKLSFGLLGSHSFVFTAGKTVWLVGGEDGDGGVIDGEDGDGGVIDGEDGDGGVIDGEAPSWAWVMLKTPVPNSVMIAVKAITIALETVTLIIGIFFIFASFFMINIYTIKVFKKNL